jgi:hypothetical protein
LFYRLKVFNFNRFTALHRHVSKFIVAFLFHLLWQVYQQVIPPFHHKIKANRRSSTRYWLNWFYFLAYLTNKFQQFWFYFPIQTHFTISIIAAIELQRSYWILQWVQSINQWLFCLAIIQIFTSPIRFFSVTN